MSAPEPRIAVIGLGYVGAPLLAAFAENFDVTGYDLDANRVAELQQGRDRTLELSDAEVQRIARVRLVSDPTALEGCNTFIVTVPTPITAENQPDLSPLQRACRDVGSSLKVGDTVVFESTVYPGATEEFCLPILEQVSGLQGGVDFQYGYSPERINPGDPRRRLQDVVKVTSGCHSQAVTFIDGLYARIIPAGTHRASSIRVAEAAKVIENTQRDVNIALVNELSMLFDQLGLDTAEVLEAAGTKWNFLPFHPGLVGGHCIPVDPYYLTYKARDAGFDPKVILAGRSVNDNMAAYWAEKVLDRLRSCSVDPAGARVLVLGLTFKPNCPDTRNSQVFKLVGRLKDSGCRVDVHDPWVSASAGLPVHLVDTPESGAYAAIVRAVKHDMFLKLGSADYENWGTTGVQVLEL